MFNLNLIRLMNDKSTQNFKKVGKEKFAHYLDTKNQVLAKLTTVAILQPVYPVRFEDFSCFQDFLNEIEPNLHEDEIWHNKNMMDVCLKTLDTHHKMEQVFLNHYDEKLAQNEKVDAMMNDLNIMVANMINNHIDDVVAVKENWLEFISANSNINTEDVEMMIEQGINSMKSTIQMCLYCQE